MRATLISLFLLLFSAGATEWQTFTNLNHIRGLARRDSLLVLATKGGLVLFDPGRVAPRKIIRNTEGLAVNDCRAAAFDRDGNCWVATDGGGLAVLPADSGSVLIYRPNELPARINALCWDEDRLLLGTDEGFCVVETRGTPLDFSDDLVRRYTVASRRELQSDRVLALAAGDAYWIGTNQGLTRASRDLAEWKGFRRPMGDSVFRLSFWQDSLLVATELGLALLDSSGFRPAFRFLRPRRIADLAVSINDIYLATDTGLYRGYGAAPQSYELIFRGDARAVWAQDTLWLGLGGYPQSGQGLAYQATGQAWNYVYLPGLASSQVSSLTFSPLTGRMHMCHYLTYWSLRAVTELSPEGGITIRHTPLINPIQVSCDKYGRIWYAHFASDGGISVYDPQKDTWGTIQWGPWSGWNVIDAFGIDGNDTKWVYNGEGVVVAIDSTGQQIVFDIPGLVPPPRGGFDFAFDSRGRAWLGLTVGLVTIDPKNTLADRSDDEYAILVNGLPSAEVRSVAVDLEDKVWCATPRGAAVWDGSRFQTFTVENSGLLDNNVYRVRTDRSGRVWFLCQSGLSLFDQVANRWTGYTAQNSGLIKSLEGVNDFYAALEIGHEQGIVAIGTQYGLSLFRPPQPRDSLRVPSVLVYPNPCLLGTNEWVVVSGLPDQARVEVRTINGKLIAIPRVDQGQRRAVWKPGNAATGVYLIQVHCPLGVRVERVAIVGR